VKPRQPKKHSASRAAAALGRRGGLKRAKNLSPKERSQQGRKVVLARWAKIQGVDRAEARAAIARVRKRAKGGGPFDWAEWKQLRDEGRK
jgi:isochorismate synthase EntC